MCRDWYRGSEPYQVISVNREQIFEVSVRGGVSEILTLELPKNYKSDVQIEVYGSPEHKYLVSQVKLGEEYLVDDRVSMASNPKIISKEDYASIAEDFGDFGRMAFSSTIRNVSELEPGAEFLILPHQALRSKVSTQPSSAPI